MKVPPRDSPAWQTPVYLQYWALKDQLASQNPNDSAFMFFRLGDFYELFGDDAVRASPLLEVQLTSRDRSQEPIPMCGIPYHAWESYAEKILSRGHKIAIVDQVEEAGAGKKLVDRQIQRILTPGLPIDPTKMSAKENHYLLALSHDPESGGVELRALDFLGRHLFAGVLKTSEEFNDLILSLNPKEILVSTESTAKPAHIISTKFSISSIYKIFLQNDS